MLEPTVPVALVLKELVWISVSSMPLSQLCYWVDIANESIFEAVFVFHLGLLLSELVEIQTPVCHF